MFRDGAVLGAVSALPRFDPDHAAQLHAICLEA